jgi:hypothetical protein
MSNPKMTITDKSSSLVRDTGGDGSDFSKLMFPFTPSPDSLVNAVTGEMLPPELLDIFSGKAVERTISVNGWVPPLRGNIIVGRVNEIRLQEGGEFGPRRVYTIEGVAHVFMGNSSLHTRAKTDPDYDPKKWQDHVGSWFVGEMQAMQNLREHANRWCMVMFGPYVPVGAKTRKVMKIDILNEASPAVAAVAKALGIPLGPLPTIIESPPA